jgi:hypothetical protein
MREVMNAGKALITTWLQEHDIARYTELSAAGQIVKFATGKSRINRIWGIEYELDFVLVSPTPICSLKPNF